MVVQGTNGWSAATAILIYGTRNTSNPRSLFRTSSTVSSSRERLEDRVPAMTTVKIIAAAGSGSRLGCVGPKGLVKLGGIPLVQRLLSEMSGTEGPTIIVVSPRHLDFWQDASEMYCWQNVIFAEQAQPNGTVEAVHIGLSVAKEHFGRLDAAIVLWSDLPRHKAAIFKSVDRFLSTGQNLVIPYSWTLKPYVQLLCRRGRLLGIKRQRDGDRTSLIGRSDLGVFGLSRPIIELLCDPKVPLITTQGGQREDDFVHLLPHLYALAPPTCLLRRPPILSFRGLNTPEDLEFWRSKLG